MMAKQVMRDFTSERPTRSRRVPICFPLCVVLKDAATFPIHWLHRETSACVSQRDC